MNTRKPRDLTGMTFGRLTVIGISHRTEHGSYHYLCRCTCGKTSTPLGRNLLIGGTKSCGCLTVEKSRERHGGLIDLAGKRFGRLIVINQSDSSRRTGIRWNCVCDCGKSHVVPGAMLRTGRTRSCGCLREELVKTRKITHGQSKTRLYRVWCAMIARCHNPNTNNYRQYGARGITVCDRWRQSFEAFTADMGPKPSPNHSLDRIDNNRGYEPGNVRWALSKEQARNTRRNHIVTLDGVSLTLVEWSEKTGLPYDTLKRRLQMGWSAKRALTAPLRGASHV